MPRFFTPSNLQFPGVSQFNPNPQVQAPDVAGTLDSVFNAYMRQKQEARAAELQGMQVGQMKDAQTLQAAQQAAQFGAPLSSFTPQEMQAAAGQQPLAASGIGPMGNQNMDRLSRLRDGLLKLGGRDTQTLQKESLGLDLTRSVIAKNEAEAWKDRHPQKPGTGSDGAKQLPPNNVINLNEGAAVSRLLPEVEDALKQSESIMGPLAGRKGSINPYDTKAQTVDARFRTASQAFGKFMEGGVLRKEDEDKYRKMFPQLTDTPDVAKNKLAIVRRQLAQKYNSDRAALGSSGYDVSGLESLSVPDSVFQGKGPKPGDEMDGHIFLGGDPAKPESWRRK